MILSKFRSFTYSFSRFKNKVKRYTDFKNEKQVTLPPTPFLSHLLQQLFSKELTDFACWEDRFRVIFLPLQKTVPQVCMAIQQDSRRTGKKVKQGSREERKNCQIKTPRKQISQYQDL